MYITTEILEEINKGNITRDVKEFLENAIELKEKEAKKYSKLEKYFNNDEDILNKNRMLPESANNKILANYARYITTLNVGYFMSEPVNYSVIDLPGTEEEGIDISPIIDVYKKNTILEVDKANSSKLSKYGKCYELIYINEDTEIRSKSINPQNAVIFKMRNLEETEALGMYFINNDKESLLYLYTVQNNLVVKRAGGVYEVTSIEPNRFNEIPLIEIKNNEEETGDFENITSLIDAYNKIMSNDVDNIEEFVDSILVVQGDTKPMTLEQSRILRESRAMSIENGTVNYLTKTLDENGLTIALRRLAQDIHKFSFTPDMSDENFAGTQSGVALEFKLLPFELHMKTKQAQYTKALKKRFKIYNIFLNILSNVKLIDLENVKIEFVRGLPKNDMEVADMITKLQGIVTDKTLISKLSFIDDVEAEIESVQMQNEERAEKQQREILKFGGDYEEEKEQVLEK